MVPTGQVRLIARRYPEGPAHTYPHTCNEPSLYVVLSVFKKNSATSRHALHAIGLTVTMVFSVQAAATAQQWPDHRNDGAFAFHANFSLNTCTDLLDDVIPLSGEVAQRLQLQPSSESIHVYLFSRRDVYEQYMRHYFPGVPYRRALFIKQRGPGMVFAFRSNELAVDLRHETTHAVLHTLLPMVPLWLDEGLAEYFEIPAADRRLKSPYLRSVRWRSRLRQVPRLSRLESLGELSDMKHDDYRDAWAWVHFMLHGPLEAQAVLYSYLADVQAHVPPGKLSERLQRRVPQLERKFLLHFVSIVGEDR